MVLDHDGDARRARVRLRPCAEPELWNRLAAVAPGGTGFHEWSFLDLAERMLGVHVERLVAEADGPVGIVPVVRDGRRSPRGRRMPFPLLGPAVPPPLLGPVLVALRRWQLRHGLVVARFDIAPELAAALSTHPHAGVEPDLTAVLDLAGRSEADVERDFSRNRRRSIQAAERAGAASRPAVPGETAELLGRVLQEAYGRHGAVSPYPPDVGAQVERWAAGRDDVRLLTGLVDGEPAGSLIVLGWHRTALAWIGAALPRFRDARPSDLMHRDALRWCLERGNAALDFAGSVDAEVQRYKRSFGAVDASYLHVRSQLLPERLGTALRR